jgi:hypothetical protein
MTDQPHTERPWLTALESIQRRMEGTTEEESLAALRADEAAAAAMARASGSKTQGASRVFRFEFDNYSPEPAVRHGSALTRTS